VARISVRMDRKPPREQRRALKEEKRQAQSARTAPSRIREASPSAVLPSTALPPVLPPPPAALP
jgi:hypothetical protein